MKKMKNDYVNLVVIYKVSNEEKTSTLMEYLIRTDFEFTKDGKRI